MLVVNLQGSGETPTCSKFFAASVNDGVKSAKAQLVSSHAIPTSSKTVKAEDTRVDSCESSLKHVTGPDLSKLVRLGDRFHQRKITQES